MSRRKMMVRAARVLAVSWITVLAEGSGTCSRGRRREVVQIQFKRSGGFSPLTNVSGGVKFDTQTAVVSVPNSDYHRTLEPEEEKELRDAARPDPDQLRSAPAPRHSDSFQYDITVTTEDGKTYELTSPSARLLSWVKQESNRILQHKKAK